MAMTSVYDERDPDDLVLEDLFHRVPGAVKTLQFNLQGLPAAPDPQVFDTLGIVYRAFSEDVPSYKRPEVLNFFIEKVRQSEYRASTVLVFVRFELNKQLVCSAVNAYLRYRQASASSAFAAVEEIIALIRNNQVANRGAVFSGLACFGDRRVNAIARTVRDCLSPEDVRVFAESVYNPLNLAALEFCIEWLLSTVDKKDFAVAAQVSFALSAMVVKNKDQVVYNTEYSFGPYAFPHVIESPTCSFETWRENIAPLLAGTSGSRETCL